MIKARYVDIICGMLVTVPRREIKQGRACVCVHVRALVRVLVQFWAGCPGKASLRRQLLCRDLKDMRVQAVLPSREEQCKQDSK